MILSSLIILAVLATALIIALSVLSTLKYAAILRSSNHVLNYIQILSREYERLAEHPDVCGHPPNVTHLHSGTGETGLDA